MKALHKDFLMEIRKSKARFISIFLIVALGVAFFAGIQTSSPDMRYSGDSYYDKTRLMDIRIMGTLGLTEDDVKAVKSIDGISDAEGAYSTDVVCGEDQTQKTLHVESLNTTVNDLTPTEGRIPRKSGEIYLDNAFADSNGYKIGDQIKLYEEGDNTLLKISSYTVTGIGYSPLYISFNRGNTTLGSGELNGFAYVLPEDFDSDVYTQIYVRVYGADGLTSYTDAYENLIDKIKNRVEGIEDQRCQIRYDEVVKEAQDKLSDAREQLEEGKEKSARELSDARKELEDGEKKLEDGRKEYQDGKKQLSDARKELQDGKKQIADARSQLEEGKEQLAQAKDRISSGRAQFDEAKSQIEDGWAQLNENQNKLDEGKKQLEEGKTRLSEGEKKIEEARSNLKQKQEELDTGKVQIESGKQQISASRQELDTRKQEYEQGLEQVKQQEAQLAQGQASLEEANNQLTALQAQYDQAIASGDHSDEELEAMKTQVEQFSAQVAAQTEQINASASQIKSARSELENALDQIESGYAHLDDQIALLEKKEAEFPAAQEKIDQGWAALEAKDQELEPARKEIKETEQKISDSQAQIDAVREKLVAGQAEIDEKEQTLVQGEAEIAANEAKLSSAEKEIAANEQKIKDGEKEIEENEKKLKDAAKDIKKAEKDLKEGKKKYQDGKKEAEQEISDGEKKIQDAQKDIDRIEKPEWITGDRNDLPEYSDYGDNADRIRNIGKVFPVIFFLVAALVSLTTMTRMVEEQRTQIGTMKALGYGKYAIASKYLLYALLATVGGSILGILIGEKIIPFIIIKGYGIMYHSMALNMQIHYELKFAILASAAAIVCTLGATVFSCYRVMAETPASLMRPPAPKEGKRILAERMTFFWKHLSFTWKSTLRNLFRYKKRLFMTIFGIAGSMGLMLVGFGLNDSIMEIAQRQYTTLQHYDGTIIYDEDAEDEDIDKLENYLNNNRELERFTHIQMTKMAVPRKGKSSLNVYVYIPEKMENFNKDVTLQDRKTKERYQLTDDGVVISEKTSLLTGLKAGDDITISWDNKDYTVKISAVTENYMGHYIYMTPALYEKTFGKAPQYTKAVFTMKEKYKEKVEDFGNEILKYSAALSISYTRTLEGQISRMIVTLGMVTLVLIVSAGMLAFVVLYNLNNINITERQRELATLKVLGFYDKEVSAYVYRENILLTIIGVAVGIVFGIFLHRYVIQTVEVDTVMFGRNIKAVSFLYSSLLTIGFSLVVNLFMHRKLKKIDMVESLKSVE